VTPAGATVVVVEDELQMRRFIRASLESHMAELRKKIELDPARPSLIVTEPGVGYRLRLPPED
jgi:DNA-binding response OmpR family regulator